VGTGALACTAAAVFAAAIFLPKPIRKKRSLLKLSFSAK
jgi:hypothetical protein